MAEANCDLIRYGVETATDWIKRDVLKRIFSEQRTREVFAETRKAGIRSFAFLLLGNPGESFEETTEAVLKYLFRSSKQVELKSLTGGYSGNIVMKSDSFDMHGREEVGHVVKIGDPEEIGRERIAFEKNSETIIFFDRIRLQRVIRAT